MRLLIFSSPAQAGLKPQIVSTRNSNETKTLTQGISARSIACQLPLTNLLSSPPKVFLALFGYLRNYDFMSRGKLSKNKAALRAMVIKSLAHPSRVLLVDALSEREMCVCDLTEVVGSDISTVSKHLAILKAAGVVSVEKRGLNQFYQLNCPCLVDFFRCVDSINHEHSLTLQRACVA